MEVNETLILENGPLKIAVKPLGAELCSLKLEEHEYLWQANPHFWPRHAPILFPIVGKLKDDQFIWKDRTYRMKQHGFARDKSFKVVQTLPDRIVFSLKSDEQTLQQYPFTFELEIEYRIKGKQLWQLFRVKNTNEGLMPFSIGAHPAFALPLDEGLNPWDYSVRFEQAENCKAFKIKEGLLTEEQHFQFKEEAVLAIGPHTFNQDALVFTQLRSKVVSIAAEQGKRAVVMDFNGFPTFALWAKPQAPFICLEPWNGHHDPIQHHHELKNKPGLIWLPAGETWKGAICITVL